MDTVREIKSSNMGTLQYPVSTKLGKNAQSRMATAFCPTNFRQVRQKRGRRTCLKRDSDRGGKEIDRDTVEAGIAAGERDRQTKRRAKSFGEGWPGTKDASNLFHEKLGKGGSWRPRSERGEEGNN